MKHTMIFLALWLLSSQDAFSQYSKPDEYVVKDATLASAKKVVTPSVRYASESSASLIAKAESPSPAIKPATANTPASLASKIHSIATHTQTVRGTTQIIQANTQAIEANTRALQENTQALEANVRAAQANKSLRRVHMKQAPATMQAPPPAPAPVQPSVSPAVLVSKPAPAPAPAIKPAAPAIAAAKPAVPQVPPAPAKPIVAAAPVKTELPKPLLAPKKLAAIMPAPAQPAAPKMSNESYRTISTMPLAAAPVKTASEYRTVSTLNTAKPVPAAAVTTVSQPKVANGVVQLTPVVKPGKPVQLGDVLTLPVLDKIYDCNISNAKYYPVAAKTGAKHGDIVTTQGYVQVVSVEDSAKANESYYLQLTVKANAGDSCFLVRIPSDQLSKETSESAKKFVRDLVKGRVPCTGGNLMRKPIYVSITGKLAYNGARAGLMRSAKVYHGKRDMHTYTPWEIANVSSIQFAMPQQ